jgi:hypothetical protein
MSDLLPSAAGYPNIVSRFDAAGTNLQPADLLWNPVSDLGSQKLGAMRNSEKTST